MPCRGSGQLVKQRAKHVFILNTIGASGLTNFGTFWVDQKLLVLPNQGTHIRVLFPRQRHTCAVHVAPSCTAETLQKELGQNGYGFYKIKAVVTKGPADRSQYHSSCPNPIQPYQKLNIQPDVKKTHRSCLSCGAWFVHPRLQAANQRLVTACPAVKKIGDPSCAGRCPHREGRCCRHMEAMEGKGTGQSR